MYDHIFLFCLIQRGENDSRANEEGILVIRTKRLLSLIILLLLLGYVIFMYIGFYILDKSHPFLKTVDVQHMHANFNIHNNDTVSLEEVRVSLSVWYHFIHLFLNHFHLSVLDKTRKWDRYSLFPKLVCYACFVLHFKKCFFIKILKTSYELVNT